MKAHEFAARVENDGDSLGDLDVSQAKRSMQRCMSHLIKKQIESVQLESQSVENQSERLMS